MSKNNSIGPSSECHKLFLNCKSKFIIFGGGAGCGKSHQALMLVLKYRKDPNFRAVFIRQTSTQLSQAGGLFQEAEAMWKQFGAKFRTHPQMGCVFPSGAQVQFKVCGADRDTSNYDGGQFSLVIFDEAQHHSENQIKYLESRIRSKAKGPHQLIATCNPKKDSYLYPFVAPYLDENGIPKPEMLAQERYYASYNGSTVYGATAEELISTYGENVKPQTYTFIAATIADNPIMNIINPDYVTRLENLKKSERQRLLLGSWHVLDTGDGFWKEDWVEVHRLPPNPQDLTMVCRSWDLAASVPSETNRDPDWTCGVKMGRDKMGKYWILDAYRFRKLSDGVLNEIIKTANEDGVECKVTIPRDAGAGGKVANSYFSRVLAENGVACQSVVMSGHSGKLARFLPFCTLSESGSVNMVEGDWNKWYIDELSVFTGGRSGHDDAVDATSDCFNTLSRSVQLPTFALPDMSQASIVPKVS